MLRLLTVLLSLLLLAPALAQDPIEPQDPPDQTDPQDPVDPNQPADPLAPAPPGAQAPPTTPPAGHPDSHLQYQEDVQVRVTQLEIGEFPTVHAFVSVTDGTGAQVRTLREQDFTLSENGVEVPGLRFGNRDELDLPLAIMFAIDVSGSMDPAMDLQKQAVRQFVQQLSPRDRVGLVTFSDAEMPEVALTEDKEELLRRVDELTGWGQTALWNGIYMAMDELLRDQRPARRALVVLSDGVDNRSLETPQTIMRWYEDNAIQHNLGFSVFTLGLGIDIDRPALSAIAERTGGMFVESPTAEQLSQVYERILTQIQSEYLLEYDSPTVAQPGQIIDVQVGVTPVRSYDPGTYTYRSPGLTGALARAIWPGLIAVIVLTIALIIATIFKLTRRAWLTVMLTSLEGKDYSLSPAGAAIGSSESADIRIGRDPTMLGYHASLRETSDGYMIEAVDPDAPIVMGQRILSRKLLRSGDRFTLGTTQFVFNEKVERPGEGLLQASGVETELPAIVGAAGSSPAAPDGQVVQPAVPAVVPKALVGTMGTFAGQRFELKPGETVIGRTEGDIVLGGDQQVSRHHAVITLEANRAFVVDPGSTNGTFISGARLQPGMQQPLSAGDSLQVGQSEFRLE